MAHSCASRPEALLRLALRDGTRIASAAFDKTVQIWEAATGKHLLSYTGHPSLVRSLAWSPDGSRIATAAYAEVFVWQAN